MNSPNDRMDSQSWHKHNDRGYSESRSKLSTQQSVSDRSQSSVTTAHLRHDTEKIYNQTQQNRPGDAISSYDPAKYVHNFSHRCRADYSPHSNTETSTGIGEEATEAASEELVDEAALIEERRKRREAIKAKHKGRDTPLLVQALAIDKSAPSTPKAITSDTEIPAQGQHRNGKEKSRS